MADRGTAPRRRHVDGRRDRRTRPQLGGRPGRRPVDGVGHLLRPRRAAHARAHRPGDPLRPAAAQGRHHRAPRPRPAHDRARGDPRHRRRRGGRLRPHPARSALRGARRRPLRGGAEHQRPVRAGVAAVPGRHRDAHRAARPHGSGARPDRSRPLPGPGVRRARCHGERGRDRGHRRRPCAVRPGRRRTGRHRGRVRPHRRRDRLPARPQAAAVVPDRGRTGRGLDRRPGGLTAVGHGPGGGRANTPSSGAVSSTCRRARPTR